MMNTETYLLDETIAMIRNRDCTFDEIAELTGVSPRTIKALADDYTPKNPRWQTLLSLYRGLRQMQQRQEAA